MQRLALFDLDNTLVDRSETFARWASEYVAAHGLDEAELPWLTAIDRDGFVRREEFFATVRTRFRLSASVPDLCDDYRTRMPQLARCRTDVLDGLDRLRRAGWRVGIVTNGHGEQQAATIRAVGLADRVDGWAVSQAEGARKPEARLFEIAAERCGASDLAGGGWCVGDSATADIEGGRKAGLRTIWIERNRPWPTGVVAPDHQVVDVADAFEILLTP